MTFQPLYGCSNLWPELFIRRLAITGEEKAGSSNTRLIRQLPYAALAADFRPLPAFRRRAAHRAFINSDSRFLPAAVKWPFLAPGGVVLVVLVVAARLLLTVARTVPVRSKAAIARSIESRSFFNSATMTSRFIELDSSLVATTLKALKPITL